MRHLVLGTAGHIDHGKTTLVHALTGTDTDRLPDEKRRGITIDLGFARLLLPDVEYAVVDVPGHESLVRNMLAGASGIDVVLLVIAADEGVMPQTREHLAIMQLLAVRRAVIALTKADLVDAEWLELVLEDVRAALAATPYGDMPIVPVSATTDQGLQELRDALHRAAHDCAERDADDLLRIPVDRVFTVRGTGTVVTGTVWSGRVRHDAVLRCAPDNVSVRVRGLQRHGESAESAAAGERVALALATERAAMTRGDVLVDAEGWQPASTLTIRLHVLPDAPPVRARQRLHVHLGTREVLARIALPGIQEVPPGQQAWAQLRLETPLVARARDRCVLRSYSPVHTIAGGIIAEPNAPRRKRLDDTITSALAAVLAGDNAALPAAVRLAGRAGLQRHMLPVATGWTPGQLRAALPLTGDVYAAGDRLFAADDAAAARARILDVLAAIHRQAPLEAGASRELLRRELEPAPGALVDAVLRDLVDADVVCPRGAAYALAGFEPRLTPAQEALGAALCRHLSAAGVAAPRLDELPDDIRLQPGIDAVARLLAQQGRLVALSHDHYADPGAVLEAVAAIRAQLPEQQPLTTGMLKQAVGVTRKYLIPLLEYLDRVGITCRVGEERLLLPERRSPSGGMAQNV